MSITTDTYSALQAAYDHFNKALFDGELPTCLLTLAFHRNARGYWRGDAFTKREDKPAKRRAPLHDEIALNPFYFIGRTDREILSTLVHEQVHLWRKHIATEKMPKTAHDKVWANKMEELGLMPSSTGAEGGKRTGKRVSHYILKGEAYDKAWAKCKVKIDWNGLLREPEHKGSRRTKYCCPQCDAKAYGKPDLNLLCGDCSESSGDLVQMEAM